MDGEIATILNDDQFRTAHGPSLCGNMVHILWKRSRIPTVKINGVESNPPRWPDGSYSVQGAAGALGTTPQTIFKWRAKGMSGQIELSPKRVETLQGRVRRITRLAGEAS